MMTLPRWVRTQPEAWEPEENMGRKCWVLGFCWLGEIVEIRGSVAAGLGEVITIELMWQMDVGNWLWCSVGLRL